MKLPALLPDEYHQIQYLKNDQDLFNQLILHREAFITFLEYACDDETWSLNHETFMSLSLEWLTKQFFQQKISMDHARRVIDAIRPHFQIHKRFLPRDMLIKFDEQTSQENSLIWGASSEILRAFIRDECREKNANIVIFETINHTLFENLKEYVHTGDVAHLVYMGQSEVLQLLEIARSIGISELEDMCEQSLKRHISESNVTDLLILSLDKNFHLLKEECYDFVDQLDANATFRKGKEGTLHLVFHDFKRDSRRLFDRLKGHITHLAFPNNLTEKPEFSEYITLCPNLKGIDLSGSKSFSDRLYDMPLKLRELDLSMCEWLTDTTLRTVLEICPQLEILSLSSNTQLSYAGFSELNVLKQLKSLNVSRCVQITDSDMQVLINACPKLEEFYLEGCVLIGESGFLDMSRGMDNLRTLDVSRTNITDYPLVELAVNCRYLSHVFLTRCVTLTEKGILEFVRNGTSLQKIDLRKCSLSERAQDDLKKIGALVSIKF